MVNCRYTIGAYVLRVHCEVESSVENSEKDNLWYLQLVYSQKGIKTKNLIKTKYLQGHEIKKSSKKIAMCDGSLWFNSRFSSNLSLSFMLPTSPSGSMSTSTSLIIAAVFAVLLPIEYSIPLSIAALVLFTNLWLIK